MRKFVVLSIIVVMMGIGVAQARDLNGSSVTFDSYLQVAPDDLQLNFTATQVTTSAEWFDRVTIRLPNDWTITDLTSTDFDTNSGVGTSTADFAHADAPCSGFGVNCGSGCTLVVHVNPNGVLSSQTLTWMIEGDTYNTTPDSVICSATDPCDDYDACYATTGISAEGADIVTGPVPVELQSFDVE